MWGKGHRQNKLEEALKILAEKRNNLYDQVIHSWVFSSFIV